MFDGLLVTDVGVDGRKTRHFRSGLGRNMQSALRHDSQQADCLERDCLATCVGSGDNHCKRPRKRINIGGHDRFRVEQWMTGLEQAN